MSLADEFPAHAQPTCSDEFPINTTVVGSGCWRCNALALDRLAAHESAAAYRLPGNFVPRVGEVVYVRQMDLDNDHDAFIARHTRDADWFVPMYLATPVAPLGLRKALMDATDVLIAFARLPIEKMDPAAWEANGASEKTQAAVAALAVPSSIPEPVLRAEFELQNAGRSLTRSATTGNYTSSTTAAMWKQHLRTAEWMTK